MIDDETISVMLSASREVDFSSHSHSHHHANGNGNGHGGAGNGGGSLSSSSGNSSSSPRKKQKYTAYTIFVRNNRTGSKFIAKRRYSDFYQLRKELIELVSWGHCQFCEMYCRQITDYPFPRRRLFRSNSHSVVKERMDSLRLFLRDLLRCIKAQAFADCKQASAQIEECILKQFLQIESRELLFPSFQHQPGVPVAIPIGASHPIRNYQRGETFPGSTASSVPSEAGGIVFIETKNRSHSVGVGVPSTCGASQYHITTTTGTAAAHGSRLGKAQLLQQQQQQQQAPARVAADTCGFCLQKWTDCYCNEEDHADFATNASQRQRPQAISRFVQQQSKHLHHEASHHSKPYHHSNAEIPAVGTSKLHVTVSSTPASAISGPSSAPSQVPRSPTMTRLTAKTLRICTSSETKYTSPHAKVTEALAKCNLTMSSNQDDNDDGHDHPGNNYEQHTIGSSDDDLYDEERGRYDCEHSDLDNNPIETSRASRSDSDCSRCSRCERSWDNCFCCQQVSPSASSACASDYQAFG